MPSGWLTAPVIGAGTSEDPIRATVADRETQDGDRLEFVIGDHDFCLVAYDVQDDSNMGDWGGVPVDGRAFGRPRLASLRSIGRGLSPTFDERLHLTQGEAPPTGSFVVDSFTDTAGTLLQNHTGETGATWTKHPGSAVQEGVISDANRLRGAGATDYYYLASGLPAAAEYDVAAVFHCITDAGNPGVLGRFDALLITGYQIQRVAPIWRLRSAVNNSFVILGSYSAALTAGNAYSCVLELRDATKKWFVDGVERISSTDNTVTAAGQAGAYPRASDTNSANIHFESFSATDVGVAAATPSQLSALGVG